MVVDAARALLLLRVVERLEDDGDEEVEEDERHEEREREEVRDRERRAAAVERLAAVRVEADLGVRVGEAAHVGVVVELLVDSMSFQDERAASAGSSAAFPRRVEFD